MYIKRRVISALYKFCVGALALFGAWCEMQTFGDAAWRLFATYVMLAGAIYFFFATIVTAFCARRSPGRMTSPMFQGALMICGLLLGAMQILALSGVGGIIALGGFAGIFVAFIVPVLFWCDWILFARKGQLRYQYPGYWLAFPLVYACGILLVNGYAPRVVDLQYPCEFLNYAAIGIDTMLLALAVLAVFVLICGYALVTLDYAAGGKLARYIVMPRIKTVVVEEEIAAPAKPAPKKSTKSPKPKKII